MTDHDVEEGTINYDAIRSIKRDLMSADEATSLEANNDDEDPPEIILEDEDETLYVIFMPDV